MGVVLGIGAGILGAVLILLIALGVSQLGGRMQRRKTLKKHEALLRSVPFEQRQYLSQDGKDWYDKDTDTRRSREIYSFAEFSKWVGYSGGKIDPGPQIDLSEPEDPFGLDGGFLNSEDFEEETPSGR